MKLKDKRVAKNILLYLGLVIIVSGHVFTQYLANLDEVWLYNFGRCIANGLKPYTGVSMVITPLFPIICASILRIFGNEMIVLRVFECLHTAAILFLVYKIMTRLKMNKGISLILVFRLVFCLFRCILP